MEASNLEATVDFIRKHKLGEEVDLVTCDTADTYMSEPAWERGFKSYNNFRKAGGNVSNIKVYRGDDAKKVCSTLSPVHSHASAVSYQLSKSSQQSKSSNS